MLAVKKVLDRVLYWCTVVLFALLLVVVWQVVSRQVLNAPATWTEEAARMMFVWLGLFAAALVFGERGHIAVEFLARKFTTGRQRLLAVLVQAVVLVFAVLILLWGGSMVMLNAWNQNLSALPFTLGQMYLALPVAGVLIAFYALYDLRRILAGQISPYPPVDLEDIGTGAAGHVDPDAVAQESKLFGTAAGRADDDADSAGHEERGGR